MRKIDKVEALTQMSLKLQSLVTELQTTLWNIAVELDNDLAEDDFDSFKAAKYYSYISDINFNSNLLLEDTKYMKNNLQTLIKERRKFFFDSSQERTLINITYEE